MRSLVVSLAVCATACADDAVLHPGPCSASGNSQGTTYECTYTYENGLPAFATCTSDAPIEPATIEATWTYDNEVLAGFHYLSDYLHSTRRDIVWDLDASPPTRHEVGDDGGVYSWVEDTELEDGSFLVGQPFDLLIPPTVEDRVTRRHRIVRIADSPPRESDVDTTFTYDSSIPTDGPRVRTDSDGQTFAFFYEGGHLVTGESYSYRWNDDRPALLVPTTDLDPIEYSYDAVGNLIERRTYFAMSFDYGCW